MAGATERLFTLEDRDSVDPGWVLTVVVCLICLFMNLLVPWLARSDLLDNRFTRKFAVTVDDEKSEALANEKGDDISGVGNRSNAGKNVAGGSVAASSAAYSYACSQAYSNAHSRAHSQAHSHAYSRARSTAGSAYSGVSVASSGYVSAVASSVLRARPRKRRGHHGTTARRVESRRTEGPVLTQVNPVHTVDAHERSANADDDMASVMSRLDLDAISVNDAVDAQDGNEENVEKFAIEDKSWFQQILDIADYDAEMKSILKLGIPYTFEEVNSGIFELVDVALVSHLIGVRSANAYIVVALLIELTECFAYGFSDGK